MDVRRGDSPSHAETLAAMRGRGVPFTFHRQLVGKRLYVQSLARFLVAVGIVAGAFGARYVLQVGDLDFESLAGLAAVLFALNVPVFLIARRHRGLERRAAPGRRLSALMNLTIETDFLFLTAALWLVGGAKSPFQVLYLLHVIIAAAFSPSAVAWAHAAMGYLFFAGLAVGEWGGVIPACSPVGLVNSAAPLEGRFVLTALCAQGIAVALGVPLMTSLTRLLQKGEAQLRETNLQLDRYTRMQRDFLHIALHDLKAPVDVAIMMARQIADGQPLPDEQARLVERILARLAHARVFLQDLGVLAALESADMTQHAGPVDMAALVRDAVAEHLDAINARGQQVTVEIAHGFPPVRGVPRLLHEAVANLVSNASKYTPPAGRIAVRARETGEAVRVEIEDSGIGIDPRDQARLFQEFVRLKTRNAALGDVAGSGLGLSIVRRIAEGHNGRVGVKSQLAQGSTFYLELPADHPQTAGF